ncbi:MAG: NusA-like transcription termination signal-binding factor [Candidatus Hodarchaeota archaeon]
MSRIKLSDREIQLTSFFEEKTGSFPKDCLYDKETRRVTFVTNPGKQTAKFIDRSGEIIRKFRVDVIEYSERVEKFLANCLAPARIVGANMEEHFGKKIIQVFVPSPHDKGWAIGKSGWKINRARQLVRRHFRIHDIRITINRRLKGTSDIRTRAPQRDENIIQQIEELAENPTQCPDP